MYMTAPAKLNVSLLNSERESQISKPHLFDCYWQILMMSSPKPVNMATTEAAAVAVGTVTAGIGMTTGSKDGVSTI